MKSKVQIRVRTIIVLLVGIFAVTVLGQAIDPVTGLPAPGVPRLTIDPATGLPMAQPGPEFDWEGPDKVLSVVYDRIPLSDAVRSLQMEVSRRGVDVKDQFDLLLPQGGTGGGGTANWASIPVTLQMNNVRASDVFRAMNLLFENDRTPLRWELRVIGDRRTAFLRLLEDPPPKPSEDRKRLVHFVGDMVGDGKSVGMSMEEIVKTVSDVFEMTFGRDAKGVIRFHKETQLVVISGTPAENDFIQQTLGGLRQRLNLQWRRREQEQAAEAEKANRTVQIPPRPVQAGTNSSGK